MLVCWEEMFVKHIQCLMQRCRARWLRWEPVVCNGNVLKALVVGLQLQVKPAWWRTLSSWSCMGEQDWETHGVFSTLLTHYAWVLASCFHFLDFPFLIYSLMGIKMLNTFQNCLQHCEGKVLNSTGEKQGWFIVSWPSFTLFSYLIASVLSARRGILQSFLKLSCGASVHC